MERDERDAEVEAVQDEMESRAEDMDERTDELEERADAVRSEWQAKRQDPSVPGARADDDESDEDQTD